MRVLLPDLVTLKFRDDEKAWRDGVKAIIEQHPDTPINPAGHFELEVPKSVADWAIRHLGLGICRIMGNDEKAASTARSYTSMWRDLGKAASPEFDDPIKLDEETQKFEEANAQWRSAMFP